MQPIDAKQIAWSLLQQHGLSGWRFQFDHARRRFGSCRPRARIITLSKPLTLLNTEAEIRDTLLHEIAHALTPGDGHGARWKAKCMEIGAAPKRCYSEAEVTAPPRRPARYSFGCPNCNWWVARRRRTTQTYLCKHCRGPVRLVERLSENLTANANNGEQSGAHRQIVGDADGDSFEQKHCEPSVALWALRFRFL